MIKKKTVLPLANLIKLNGRRKIIPNSNERSHNNFRAPQSSIAKAGTQHETIETKLCVTARLVE